MKKSNTNMPIAFYAGLLVVFLTFFSVHMSSGLYARYTTQASGEDSARVAKFDLSASQISEESLLVELGPGETKSYTFEFTNSGETTLRYKIILTNTTQNLPLVLNGATGIVPMGETVENVTCTIAWPMNTETGNPTNPQYAGMVDVVKVNVIVEQVD